MIFLYIPLGPRLHAPCAHVLMQVRIHRGLRSMLEPGKSREARHYSMKTVCTCFTTTRTPDVLTLISVKCSGNRVDLPHRSRNRRYYLRKLPTTDLTSSYSKVNCAKPVMNKRVRSESNALTFSPIIDINVAHHSSISECTVDERELTLARSQPAS